MSDGNPGGSPPGRSRRNVLKTVGGVGLAAGAIPLVGSASSGNAQFLCSVDFPTLYHKDDSPVDPNYADGQVKGGFSADYLLTSNNATMTGCNWWGSDCDGFRVNFPFTITWKTDADSWDVGDVYVRLDVENKASTGSVGWGWTLDSTSATVDSADAIGSLEPEFPTTNVDATNYFRPGTLTMTVDFQDSDIYDGSLSQEMEFATPNKELLEVENLISTTDTVYGRGVDLADELVRIDLGRLRKAARLWAYSPLAADGIDPDGLPEQAVVRGISAFEDPIEDRVAEPRFGEDSVVTMAGPTVMHT